MIAAQIHEPSPDRTGVALTVAAHRGHIERVEREGRELICCWSDGHRSRFHAIWLRDNCGCPECRDPGTGHRLMDVLSIPDEIAPDTVRLTSSGDVEIVWTPGGHASRYEVEWLRAHCYSDEERLRRRRQPVLWGAEIAGRIPTFADAEVRSDEPAQFRWLSAVRDYGFARLRGVPAVAGEVERVAALVGYIRETNYGRTFDVISMPQPTHLAYTPRALAVHVDNPYRVPTPGLQMLLCIEAASEGGDTVLVDGFRAADELNRADPAAYHLLTRVPMSFRYRDAETDLYARQPVIALDADGQVAAIHFNDRAAAPLEIAESEVEPFYAAYRKFARLVRDPALELRFRLAPGHLLFFDNQRALHGRTAFDASAGRRFLQGCYLDRDGLESRLRVLARRMKGS
jgi:gamma-butyrobetaine hydroxylase